MSQTLPKQNDFHESNYSEELKELMDFGINTKKSLLDLISKHRDAVLEIDASEMDDFHINHYISEYGKEYMEDRLKNKFWFAYPALLRIILSLEFGDKYEKYANKRDGIRFSVYSS
ncbi:MAG: hypothetical protein WCU83_12570 [Bacteroidia bacterium]